MTSGLVRLAPAAPTKYVALGEVARSRHLLEVDAGAGHHERDGVRRPAGTAEAVDEVPAVGTLGREDDDVGVEVEDLGDLRGHVGGRRLDRDADVLEVGHRPGQLGVAGHAALQHVERLLLEVVVADDPWRGVGPRHGDTGALELLGGGVDRARVGAEAATAGTDREHARRGEVTDGDRHGDQDVLDAGLGVDREVVPEEVDRRDHREGVLAGQLVGALLRVGRVDRHRAGLELDRPSGPTLGRVAAQAAELLVDVVGRGFRQRLHLREGAGRVARVAREPDHDGLALGLERLLGRALDVGGELAGVLALDGVDGLVGLAGRADAALALAARRRGGCAAAAGGGRSPARRRRRGGRRGGRFARCRGGCAARRVVVVAAGRGEQCECTHHDEWLQHSRSCPQGHPPLVPGGPPVRPVPRQTSPPRRARDPRARGTEVSNPSVTKASTNRGGAVVAPPLSACDVGPVRVRASARYRR